MRIAAYRAEAGVAWGSVEGDVLRPHPDARAAIEVAGGTTTAGAPLRLDSLHLASPVGPLLRNVFCVGWNYVAHFEEGAKVRAGSPVDEIPDLPTFFTKATRSVVGPYDPIESHAAITQTLDWEVELAVIIGREGRDIPEPEALDHVLGYTVANDVSARNVQRGHGGQWFRGKSLDATSPIGPWIVTPDELGDVEKLGIRCRVNGEVMQDATLADMHFGVPRIIAELSRGLTILPGDVILTGTPPGVGFARTPPQFLSVGDVVESEIDGIGMIRNEIRA